MTWVWLVLVIVVLGVTAAVAIGRGDTMWSAPPDRADVRLPADRRMSAQDVAELRFSVVVRGYRMDEVDEVITRLTQEIAARDARLAELDRPGGEPPDSIPDSAADGRATDPGERRS